MKPLSVRCRFTTDWFRGWLGEYWRNVRHSLLDGEGDALHIFCFSLFRLFMSLITPYLLYIRDTYNLGREVHTASTCFNFGSSDVTLLSFGHTGLLVLLPLSIFFLLKVRQY